MDTIRQIWQRIEATMRWRAPAALSRLAPGATEQTIKQLEDRLEVSLPTDFQASYLLHDGGFTMGLVSPMEIMPLEHIADWWRNLEELLHDDEWATQAPYYFSDNAVSSGWQAGPIRQVWWDRRWIPFASDPTGNLSCLDLAPAPGGTMGQVIDWDHECGPSRVLFPSFQQLLEAFADQLERNDDKPT